MISVSGSRDGRKGLGLGFGGGGEMEETEFEEGEAYCYIDDDDDDDEDAIIDPDVSFAYIDDRIQNILGHLRKDFEGGVSAENLGAKFGGYGSFLPAYQRSPGGPPPRTPQKVHYQNTFASPETQSEGGHLARHRPAATNISTLAATKAPSMCDSSEHVGSVTHVEGLKPKSIVNQSDNLAYQKPLKFRIKMGSGSISTQNNAAIYSGLGLDVSPSTSLEDSLAESEGLSCAPLGVAEESSNTIIQLMTSFPIRAGRLLSPLPDDLVCLTKIEIIQRANRMGSDPEVGRGSSVILANGSDTERTERAERRVIGQNKMRLVEVSDISTQSVWDDLKIKSVDDIKVYPKKNGEQKGEKIFYSVKRDSNAFKGGSVTNREIIDPPLKTDNKAISIEHNSKSQPSGKEHSSSVRKNKSKGIKSHDPLASEIPKERSTTKGKKDIPAENEFLKRKSEHLRLGKDSWKDRDIYRDLFGDVPLEPKANEAASFETPHKNASFAFNNESKENFSVKKIGKSSTIEPYSKTTSNCASLPGNRIVSDATQPTVAPVDSKDNWVCCDKCQTWRLLPIGLNPEILPEKWLCSMLNWLNGMNRCSFSEDETTKAVIALNQASQLHNQNNLQVHHNEIVSGGSSANVRFPDQHQHLSNSTVQSESRKKPEIKDMFDNINQKDPAQFSGSTKKIQPSAKKRTLTEVNQSPLVDAHDFRKLQKSTGSAAEKHRSKKKDKNKLLDQYSDGDNTNNSKIKSKRRIDQNNFEAYKKIKKEATQYLDDVLMPEQGFHIRKTCPSSSDCMPVDLAIEHGSSSKNLKRDGNLKVSITNSRDQRDDTSMDLKKYGNVDIGPNKRKVKECRDNLAKTSKDQKVSQYLERAQSPQNLSGTAAISSSSMVSGPNKSKTNFQKVKGSPVESVSSSPLRISKLDKLTVGRTNIVEKDDQSGAVRKEKHFAKIQYGSHESSVLDFEDRDFNHVTDSKPVAKAGASIEGSMTDHFLSGNADISGQHSNKPHSSGSSSRKLGKGSSSRKLGKGSSSRSKDKFRNSKSEHEKHKRTGYTNESQGHTLSIKEQTKDGKNNFQEKHEVNFVKLEKTDYTSDCGVKLSGESSKKENHSKLGSYGGRDAKATKHNLPRDYDGLKSSTVILTDKSKNDRAEITSSSGMLVPPPPSSGPGQNDTQTRLPKQAYVSLKENGTASLSADASDGGVDALRGQKQIRKAENENGGSQINSRHAAPNVQRVGTVDAPSPLKRDLSAQAANNALKEAKDLKHLADRLKTPGSNNESIGIYFEAAMKFLYGASLLESCNNENSRPGDQSMQIFSSTAKLCEFCAHEFERSKDMAGAALAYKCMEVAYMRVIYFSNSGASRDRHELHSALHMVPPGESPSSSASDVDNLINLATVDKVGIPKGVCSPQIAGNHAISAQNRPSLLRILNYAQDVNSAMEASRKSRTFFGAASGSLEVTRHKESISSIKKALDFNFHDVEGLLRLIRLAMEAMGR